MKVKINFLRDEVLPIVWILLWKIAIFSGAVVIAGPLFLTGLSLTAWSCVLLTGLLSVLTANVLMSKLALS